MNASNCWAASSTFAAHPAPGRPLRLKRRSNNDECIESPAIHNSHFAILMIRILIADDHPIVRDGLTAVLSTQADFEIVGTAGDGEEVLRRVPSLRPDVLLLDLEMPRLDGVATLHR